MDRHSRHRAGEARRIILTSSSPIVRGLRSTEHGPICEGVEGSGGSGVEGTKVQRVCEDEIWRSGSRLGCCRDSIGEN